MDAPLASGPWRSSRRLIGCGHVPLRTVLEYTHGDPARAGIAAVPTAYPWSSVHTYEQTGRELIKVNTEW